jgi:hypothetical protein
LIAVTNVSDVAARNTGNYELKSKEGRISVVAGVRGGAHRLLPGQGAVYEVSWYPEKGPQEYSLHFIRDGLRTRLSEWVADNVAPGSWMEPFIPAILKSVPPPFKVMVVVPE